MPLAGNSLDERWLEFLKQTEPLAQRFPSFISVRQEFFKIALERKDTVSLIPKLRELARPIVCRERSRVPKANPDVLFCLENGREVMVETVLPVRQALAGRGLTSMVAAPPEVLAELAIDEDEAVAFRAPHVRMEKKKWLSLMDGLEAALPGVLPREAKAHLLSLGGVAERCESEMRRILTALKPRLVVLAIDQLMPGSSTCVAARSLGIGTLVLLHGAVSGYNAPVNADEMGVWGEVSREQMEGLGVERDRLKVLGSPRHDHPPTLGDPSAAGRLGKALGCPDLPIFTFFSNGNDLWRNSEQAVSHCADWLSRVSQELRGIVHVAVRLHPNEDGSLYEGLPGLRVFKGECDLGTTLAGSAIIGGLCSTCLLEGVLYGKPVLQFFADGWPELADNWRRGLALRIDSATSLEGTLRAILTEGDSAPGSRLQQGRKPLIFAHAGSAAERTAAYIEDRCRGAWFSSSDAGKEEQKGSEIFLR